MADGILKKVIGSFNPFCDGDKDPLAEQTDQCANYSRPPDDEGCPLPSKQSISMSKSTAGKRHGVLPYLLYLMLFEALTLHLDNLLTILKGGRGLVVDERKRLPIILVKQIH